MTIQKSIYDDKHALGALVTAARFAGRGQLTLDHEITQNLTEERPYTYATFRHRASGKPLFVRVPRDKANLDDTIKIESKIRVFLTHEAG